MFFETLGKKEELLIRGRDVIMDESGNNRTLTNSTTTLDTGINGEYNGSLYFDGADQLSWGDLDLNSDFTICFWLKLHSDRNNNFTNLILKRGTTEDDVPYSIALDDRDSTSSTFKLYFSMNGGGSNRNHLSLEPAISDFGIWYHMAFTIKGIVMTTYINGEAEATRTFDNGTRLSNNVASRIGGYFSNNPTLFAPKGHFADIRQFSSALPQSTIKKIMNEQNQFKRFSISATDPKLFYSVRRLYPNYIGPCMTIRRSSDNATQDIYFDSNGDLDTSAITTFISSGDAFVEILYDQSGNGVNAVQTTTENQPRIAQSGTVHLVNSKPAIYFSGSKWLSINPIKHNKSALYANIVAKPDNTTNRGYVWGQYDTDSKRSWVISFENNAKIRVVFSDSGLAIDYITFDSTTNYTTNQQLVETQFTPDTALLWRDGSVGPGTYVTEGSVPILYTSTSPIEIGRIATSGLSFQGYVQEFSMYDQDMTSLRSGIASSINSYFSIY